MNKGGPKRPQSGWSSAAVNTHGMVGAAVGAVVGVRDGAVGSAVGVVVGSVVGSPVRLAVGSAVGPAVGGVVAAAGVEPANTVQLGVSAGEQVRKGAGEPSSNLATELIPTTCSLSHPPVV